MKGILESMRRLKELIKQQSKLSRFIAHSNNLKVGSGVTITNPYRLFLGKNVRIDSNSFLDCGGLEWCDHKGKISMGDDSFIGPNSVLFGAGEIYIGKNVLIAPNVTITSHQHTFKDINKTIKDQPTKFNKITIEDDVWIGANATILPGVTIGKGSVIGAGAVVNKNIPPYSVAVGVPAKVIKKRKNK